MTATRIADGMYRVEHEGRNEILYVAGPAADRWIFWNGRVYRGDQSAGPDSKWGGPDSKWGGPYKVRPTSGGGLDKVRPITSLTAPMPARVSQILAKAGAAVGKGDVLVVLEAMKMELPVRAPEDGVVTAVHCQEGELVQADALLVELK